MAGMLLKRRDVFNIQSLLWLGFFAIVLLAWLAVYLSATGMGDMGPAGDSKAHMGVGFWTYYSMWAIMIGAMMLPTIVPILRVYNDLPLKDKERSVGWIGIVAGYWLIWLASAAVFGGVNSLLPAAIGPSGVGVAWFSAALFVAAGAWQFTRTKDTCQSACMSPLQYFLAAFRPGLFGGARMGAYFGIRCLGCCWAIMALGLIGGAMNLLWMGLATLFMVMEKIPQLGRPLRRPAGVVLLIAGGVQAAGTAASFWDRL